MTPAFSPHTHHASPTSLERRNQSGKLVWFIDQEQEIQEQQLFFGRAKLDSKT
jgi:hypothetical protein